MMNSQFEEVEKLLRKSSKKDNECPTCGTRRVKYDPAIGEWPASTYKAGGDQIECDCATQVNLFRHYLLARIPEEYMRYEESDFWGDPGALTATKAYIDNWDNFKYHGIGIGYYSQRQGTGKTMLATFVARAMVKQGESVYFTNFRDIVGLYSTPYGDRIEEKELIKDCTLLVLDEVVPAHTYAQQDLFGDRLEELVRYRSNYNKVTIITTNLLPQTLNEEYPRTYSLLSAKEKRITVNGDDSRPRIWSLNTYLAENGERRAIS